MTRDEDYDLTLNQKSIDILLRLRGKFITPEEVLQEKPNLKYQEAVEIASKCNELLLEFQRFLYRVV